MTYCDAMVVDRLPSGMCMQVTKTGIETKKGCYIKWGSDFSQHVVGEAPPTPRWF